jgi:hypothetical protein
MTIRLMRVVLVMLGVAGLGTCGAMGEEAPKPAAPATQPSQADLEAAFAARLSNAVLAGQYTLGNSAPKKDKYTLISVRKLKDDEWLFSARVQFGNKDVTIPMFIPVKWAGDTPVISVTKLKIPAMGTYTARVMIYADHYAGSGHLWGRIEKLPTTRPAGTTPPPTVGAAAKP